MPLQRVQVRNEYGLGQKELYLQVDREDPKALLQGVTVAGLVGILRQLGDLAEFAAEIFHGLQEQVIETACRSRKLMVRVQNVEAALPSIEKAVLAQTNHIHFAYTAGSEWHPRLRTEQNHLISHDLPCFIMDSYEECHDPPRLHFLDKFDVGGPGSCMKRYSDPTFFKRSSTNSDKTYPSKVQRNKKVHKTRRKRSLHQNGQGLHGLSVSAASDLSGRMQLSFINGQASPTQSASIEDMTGRKGPEDDLDSSHSKSEPAYVEILNLNPEQPQADLQEDSRESPDLMTLELDDAQDSASTLEQIRTGDGEFHEKTMEEEDIVIDPSCVVWDEKAQILEPQISGACIAETSEMFFVKSDLSVVERGAVNLQNECETDILFVDSNVHQLPSYRNQIDEAESEPDNYVDALNTIESEPENDFDFITRQEVGPYTFNGCYNADQTHDVNAPGSDCHPPKLDSYPESCVTSDKEIILDLPESISTKHYTHEQRLENSGEFHSSNYAQGASFQDNFDTVDDPTLKSATLDDAKTCGSSDPLKDNLTSRFHEPGELSPDLSSSNSAKLWTNGTLFGLEPSKPPDFAVPNVVRQPSWNACETALSVAPNDISSAPNFNQKNDESSSQLFGLGNECFVSGFQRMNLSHNENVEHLSSLKAAVLKQRSDSRRGTYQTLPETTVDRQFELDFPPDSLPSSPRLEHMKISFHPINGFETPQLKLNFPCEIESYESIGTTFPSFQLVSEQTSFIDEICLDSDYDTFCRSSPYMSDDGLSNHSDSSSNQWESREYQQSRELGIYDALGGVSPMGSIPSFVDLGGMIDNAVCMDAGIRSAHVGNSMEPSYFDPQLDLQSSNSMREEQHDFDPINLLTLQVPLKSTSLVPPLPPAQWRLTKAFSDITENRRNFDPIRGPNTSKQELFNDASAIDLLQVELNLNGENKANQRGEGKGKEESESFLQQIRSKSFSLRRTVSDKSTNTHTHVPNVKVTAILEKASAIRQAVGSDHGDDDETWSDS